MPSSYVALLIGLCQLYRLYVCQYGVFKLKLILSYLPVQLTYSLPSSPLIGKLMMLISDGKGVAQLVLPGVAARRTIQAARILYLV